MAGTFRKTHISFAVGLAACLCATTGYTQGSLLEEVVVTAQKREENVSDVPVAVSVLSAQQINAAHVQNLEEMALLIPSVSFRTGNTTRNSAVTIRGIGTVSFSIAAEPSVSTVVDNVVLGRSGQAFGDMYDLERLEVLRGPQGTLFGKNASAGVVNITTKRPGDEFEGYIDGSFYQDNEYLVKARASGPLTDEVNASITAFDADFDGYVENVFNNNDINGYDKRGYRIMLDYTPRDTTSILFIYEDYNANNDCCVDLEARPSGRNPDSEAAPGGTGLDLGQRKADHDFRTVTEDETTAWSVQIEHEWNDHLITSITAQRDWNNTEFREGDFTSIAGDSTDPVFGVPFQLHDIGPQEWSQFSQELRIASPVGQTIEYQLGLFYWDIDSERQFTRDASCQNNNGQLDAAIANHLEFALGLPNDQAAVDAFIAANDVTCGANDIVSATGFMKTEFENYAAFGHATWNISEQFRMQFGLRYTSDDVEYQHNRRNNDNYGRRGVGVRPRYSDGNEQFDTNLQGDTDETNVSGKVVAMYDFRDELMAYASYAQGYKGPAFNVFYNMDIDDINPIDPEESDAYEIGAKWASGNLLLNAAVYYTAIEDFQANDFDTSDGTTITGFTNGGDVETRGVELDFMWYPIDNWQLSGGFAFSDSETDNEGDPLPFAPDSKYSLMSDYYWPLDNGASIALNASVTYVDEQLSGNIGQDENSNPEVELPDYTIVNAALTYAAADDKWSASLVGKNLGDEEFATTYSGDGFRYQIPREAERYFGVNFRLNF